MAPIATSGTGGARELSLADWMEEQEEAEIEALEARTGLTHPDGVPGVARIVAQQRGIFLGKYRAAKYPHLTWEADEWDIRPPAGQRTESEKEIRACQWKDRTGQRGRGEPMPAGYADVAKAWVVSSGVAPKSMSRYANATRFLWTAIKDRWPKQADGTPAPFTLADWAQVDAEDFLACEATAGAAGAKSTTHTTANVAHILKHFARWLHDNEICPALEYTPGVRKQNPSQRSDTQGKQARLDRMPTKTAIEGLGRIYWQIVSREAKPEMRALLDIRDRVYIRAVGLLVVGGFRVSEVVSLPVDCLQREVQGGRERAYLKYWNRKTRRKRAQWGRRWLSPEGAKLAERLVGEILDLTADARRQALRLEQDMTTLPVELDERVTVAEWADILGVSRDGLLSSLQADTRKPAAERRFPFYTPVGKGRKLDFDREDVMRALMRERGSLVAYNPGGGQRPQTVSGSLFIFPKGLTWGENRGDSRVLVDFLSTTVFTKWLCGATKSGRRGTHVPSIFGRFKDETGHPYREPHGGEVAIRPHMARHWLNTVANKSGMTAFQITLWMGRQDWKQTLFYLHDHADLADLVREGIEDGTVTGPAAEIYHAMPAENRDEYLTGLEHAHKMAGGFCVATACECDRAKVCENCGHVLRTEASESETAARRERREAAATAFATYDALRVSGRRVIPRVAEIAAEMVAVLDQVLAAAPRPSGVQHG